MHCDQDLAYIYIYIIREYNYYNYGIRIAMVLCII